MQKTTQSPLGRRIVLLALGALALSAIGCQAKSSSKAPAAKASDMKIEDVEWRVLQVGAKTVEHGTEPVQFRLNSVDQRATGYSGLNRFMGGYTLSGSTLRFSQMAMTRRAGPQGAMAQEAALMDVLEKTASWRPAAGRIELLDSDAKVLARLGPAESAPPS